jgi:hypothetical protein
MPVTLRAMIEQLLGKATSIIVAGAQEQHGLHVAMVGRKHFTD